MIHLSFILLAVLSAIVLAFAFGLYCGSAAIIDDRCWSSEDFHELKPLPETLPLADQHCPCCQQIGLACKCGYIHELILERQQTTNKTRPTT